MNELKLSFQNDLLTNIKMIDNKIYKKKYRKEYLNEYIHIFINAIEISQSKNILYTKKNNKNLIKYINIITTNDKITEININQNTPPILIIKNLVTILYLLEDILEKHRVKVLKN